MEKFSIRSLYSSVRLSESPLCNNQISGCLIPMNSIRKRHKPLRQTPVTEETLDCGGGGDEDNKEDRISNLPDSVLCHILSKLPTKFAAGTGVLSSKWKHLFASIPNLILDIDDSLLLHPHRPADSNRNTKFIAFMHHLLTVTLRDFPCLRRFRLHCNENYSSAHIDSWVSAALGLNVSSLTLFFSAKNTGVSLDRVFGCTTLVDLLWSQHYLLNVPDYVCLPNLKRLFIDYARFRTGDSLKRILAGCPVLEELSLDSCEFDDIEVLDISSPSLKLFMMHNCYCEDGYEVVIDTPMLELLYYNDYVAKYYPVRNLNSLLKAHIDIGPSKEQLDEDEEEEEEDTWFYDLNVAELVIACSNVDYLYLSNASVSAVYCSFQPIPTFHNLTELKLGDLNLHGWELLPRLLECAPNLEILVFTGGISESGGCFTRFQSSLPNYALPCVSLRLTKIYFEEFKGEDDEIELAEYFLKNTEALKRMEFRFCSSLPLEKQFYTWTKLLALQKRSRNCIEFHRDVKINIVKFCLMDEN